MVRQMKSVGTRLVILLVAAQPFKVVVALVAELTAYERKNVILLYLTLLFHKDTLRFSNDQIYLTFYLDYFLY